MAYWLSLVYSSSIKAYCFEKTLGKFEYLSETMIFLVSKEAIWTFLSEYIDFKLREDT